MRFLLSYERILLFLWLGFSILVLSSCSVLQNNSDLIHLRNLKDQAFAGSPEAQYQLGIHYTTNGQWDWDKARGYRWFLEAAEAGYPDAQYMVGMSQLLGRGTTQDEAGAVIWLTRAAEQGHSRSQYQLGQAYLNGTGTVKDTPWGRYWLEQAAWAEHPQAQFLLAALFKAGLGGQKNLSEALFWLRRSDKNGNKEAEIAVRKMEPTVSEEEKQRSYKLLKRIGKVGQDGLYQVPKVRYLQTRLNAMDFAAGVEDGEYGSMTQQAVDQYLQNKELPRDTSIDALIRYLRGTD